MNNFLKVILVYSLKWCIAFWIFSLCRILFYLFNINQFTDVTLINFLGGIRFDWMTITILYSPFLIGLFVFPSSKSKVLKYLFLFSSTLALFFNLMDIEYFKFTGKRTTADLFTTSGMGNDFVQLIPAFLADYWYFVLLFIALIYCVNWLFEKVDRIERHTLSIPQHIGLAIVLTAFYFLGYRGGYQYRPLNVIQASQYATSQNIPLVLNTPFTIFKSINKSSLEIVTYFPEKELEQIYSPTLQIKSDSAQNLNVVLIILESFSKEYTGKQKDGHSFTPFLDSLEQESLSFQRAFANGKKSIEGLPAILSGIPTLMNTAYISSKYSSNRIESLPSVLEQKGYQTSFYHGGENGTMGFQAFTQIAGIDRYIGKNEYPNENDYDGNWGIFDEPFLQFVAQDLSKQEEPFFSGIFTLSSHHPYTIPEQHKGKFKEGKIPILKSISYADYSLKQFFKTAKQQAWFKNTLFIITADHTQHNLKPSYNNSIGQYRIPLFYYLPNGSLKQSSNKVSQQNDIFPTTLSLLGIADTLVTFGNPTTQSSSFAISYINEIYQMVEDDYVIQFDGQKTLGFYRYNANSSLSKNLMTKEKEKCLLYEKKIKGIIQQYQSRLIHNQLSVRE